MLNAIKRWFASEMPASDRRAIAAWASAKSYTFKRVRGDQGFVVDGRFGARPWRLEWGPAQRAYIPGHELRLRMELGLPSGLQMLVLSRPLMEALERETFDRFTEGMQTRVDNSMPEEMRWLALFPKVDLAGMKGLRPRFGAVAGHPASVLGWLEGPLGERLEDDTMPWHDGRPPFVLMTLRGRLYLRMQMDEPIPQSLSPVVRLYETAMHEALRVAGGDAAAPGAWPSSGATSSGPTAWQSQFGGDEPPARPRR